MPARKTRNATPAVADPSATNGQPAAGVTTREAAVKSLMAKGKKRGSLTYDEIAAVSAAFDEDDPEKGNELVEEIMGQGIEITTRRPGSRYARVSW